MEWSLGVESWSGVLEWILEWNEVRDVLKPPGSLLATDRSKAVVLV